MGSIADKPYINLFTDFKKAMAPLKASAKRVAWIITIYHAAISTVENGVLAFPCVSSLSLQTPILSYRL